MRIQRLKGGYSGGGANKRERPKNALGLNRVWGVFAYDENDFCCAESETEWVKDKSHHPVRAWIGGALIAAALLAAGIAGYFYFFHTAK